MDAETDDAALSVARPAHRQHHQSLVKLWHDFGAEPAGRGFTDDLDLMIGARVAFVGSPGRVRDQLLEWAETSGCNYLVCHLHFGGMTHEQALRSLTLFAEEVMPAFTARDAVPR